MNLLKNTLVSKLMLAALFIVGAQSAFAASELTIPSVAFNDYEVKEIPVTFKHGGDMGGLQFDVKLSKSLEFASDEFSTSIIRNASFFSDGQNMSGRLYGLDTPDAEWGRVLISSRRGNPFAANEGVVVTLRVKVRENHLDKTVVSAPEFAITINNAKATDPTGQISETVSCPAAPSDQVSAVKMSFEGGDFVMNPSSEVSVALNLNNIDTEVAGMQFDVIVPEGFSMKNYQLTDRASNGAFLDYFTDKNNPCNVRFIVSDEMENKAFSKNEGAILTFTLVSPAEFPETAVINVEEILVSSEISKGNIKEFRAPNFSVTITNGATIKTTADAKIAELEAALAGNLKVIAEQYPDVAGQFTGAEVTEQINALKEAVGKAYADMTLSSKYDEVMAPAAEIEKAIAALIPAAQQAQGYATCLAAANALNDQVAATLAQVKEQYPAVYDAIAEQSKSTTDKIAKLIADINAAKEAGTAVENFAETVAEVEAETAALLTDAEKAAKLLEAKTKADEAVKALNDALAAAQKTIADECPLVAEQFNGEEIAAAIAKIGENVDAAVADKTLADNYKDVVETPAAEVTALIETLVKEAKAAQAVAEEEAKAEADRVAKNKAAYEADLAAIKALEDELAAVIAEFDKEWTNLHLDYQASIKREIKDLKGEVEAENARVAEEGEYAYELDPSMVKAMIAEYKNKVVTSGIDSIIADEDLKNVRIYTIDGVRHNSLVPGVNIIVKADGTTTKVYVK